MNGMTIEQRIAHLQGQMTPMPSLNGLDLTSIRSLVMEETQRALANMSNPSASAPTGLGTQILNALGTGLVEDQQLWLSEPSNQALIPEFLNTLEGQAFTRRFFSSYKNYAGKVCK
jgi:hypothetical protein